MTNKHFTFHKLPNVVKSSLLLKPGMEHGTRNGTCNGTWKLEHAMELGNWNMHWNIRNWNMEIGTCIGILEIGTWKLEHGNWNMQRKMEWDIEWKMQ